MFKLQNTRLARLSVKIAFYLERMYITSLVVRMRLTVIILGDWDIVCVIPSHLFDCSEFDAFGPV